MKLKISIFLIYSLSILQLFICFALWAEETHLLEPIVVYPDRDTDYAQLYNAKFIDDLSCSVNLAVSDALEQSSALDLAVRGPVGLQADLRMRGNYFEQTDILLDGVNINDPQTGHFNLDLPLFVEDMHKIVIVSGPAPGKYGAGRPGGAVHFITKEPQGNSISTKVVFGEHNFSSQALSCAYVFTDVNSQTTIGQSSSKGYRYNTDFDQIGVSHISSYKSEYGDFKFNFHFLDKDFGANSFYSEFYPAQREHTKTVFSSLGLNRETGNFLLSPKIYLRKHKDRFMLDYTRPGWYENFHTNYVSGVKIDTNTDFLKGNLFAGIDLGQESIESTNLGTHSRQKNIVYSEYSAQTGRFFYNTGLNGYFYQGFKERIFPNIAFGYECNDALKIHTGFSRSFRVPSFTELYYHSPANIGNENLVPEESENYEIGFDYTLADFSSCGTFFVNKAQDLIDWVRQQSAAQYEIKNISQIDSYGMEWDFKLFPQRINPNLSWWKEIALGYAYVHRDKQENGLISKYSFDFLEHKITLQNKYILPKDIVTDIDCIYQQRIGNSGDFVMDVKLAKKIFICNIFLKVDNIFNRSYSQVSGIPMPGRWAFLGTEIKW